MVSGYDELREQLRDWECLVDGGGGVSLRWVRHVEDLLWFFEGMGFAAPVLELSSGGSVSMVWRNRDLVFELEVNGVGDYRVGFYELCEVN